MLTPGLSQIRQRSTTEVTTRDMETAEQIEQAAPGSAVSAPTQPVASGRPVTDSTGILAHIPEPARVVNRECGICGHTLRHSSWVTHRGLRTHPSCFARSGEQPDSVSGVGKYGPGGDYFEAARAVAS